MIYITKEMTIKHHIQNSKNSCSHCHGVSVKCGNVECRMRKVKYSTAGTFSPHSAWRCQ